MKLPNSKSELQDIIHQLIQRISELETKNAALEEENKALQAKLNQNSQNSSKPPSSDGYKKVAAFPKTKGGKKEGKKGHEGKTLLQVENPDFIKEHKVTQCTCGRDLSDVASSLAETRQVFDLPLPRLEVIAHQIFQTQCPDCGRIHKSNAPKGVNAPVQYGNGVKALVTLLSSGYKLPFKKIQLLFTDLFGYPINEATIDSANRTCFQNLEETEKTILQKITESKVAHADETGLRVAGKLNWLHALVTPLFTYLFVHAKRGKIAMESEKSHLSSFFGWLVHDCWGSYFGFTQMRHAICNAHILREFQPLIDSDCKWAQTFRKFLLTIYHKPFQERLKYKAIIEARYDTICRIADHIEPAPRQKKSGKGRHKRTKGRNLLERLVKNKDAVLAFAFNPEVPFTNNQAERDVRPAKVKQKISGCFRTFSGAEIYARIESFVSTARKNQLNIFKELQDTFNGYNYFTPANNSAK